MCKTVGTIIPDNLFPYPRILKFQLYHKPFHFSFYSFMVMPFLGILTVRNYIFLFSHRKSPESGYRPVMSMAIYCTSFSSLCNSSISIFSISYSSSFLFRKARLSCILLFMPGGVRMYMNDGGDNEAI